MAAQEGHTTTREVAFDDLAKGLARGAVSRRKALRIVGATLVGGLGQRPMLRSADSLWRAVRKPEDQRAPLWQLWQPLPFNPDLLRRPLRKPPEKRVPLWQLFQPLLRGVKRGMSAQAVCALLRVYRIVTRVFAPPTVSAVAASATPISLAPAVRAAGLTSPAPAAVSAVAATAPVVAAPVNPQQVRAQTAHAASVVTAPYSIRASPR
jgi:hypothetical protein